MSAFDDNKVYRCPLCGYSFTRAEKCPHSCPMAKEGTCNVVCCPNCGYSFSEDSRVVDFFGKLFARKKKRAE